MDYPLRGFQGQGSGCFFDTASADASRADAKMLPGALNDRFHAPQIRIPASAARVIRVTDYVPVVRRLAA